MRTFKTCFAVIIFLLFFIDFIQAQPKVRVVAGMISLADGTTAPKEKRYIKLIDSLDRNLKLSPNDTTSLFYRSLLYLRYNSIVANPDLSNSEGTDKLLLARRMADKADSLKMRSFNLKVLRAQICKELTNRYAPMDLWRFNNQQIADRKKKFEYFKGLSNKYYDELALLDKHNDYDYKRLKVKD